MTNIDYTPFDINALGLPEDKRSINFFNLKGDMLQGTYIPQEEMFFIGFEDSGEFLFARDVSYWSYTLTDVKIEANERFFESVFIALHNGGKYEWLAERELFTKVGDKFEAETKAGYLKIQSIVSKDFLDKRFKNKNK